MPTVMGERFPPGMAPGDRIEWRETAVAEGDHLRSGIVVDRAANGVGQGCELAGVWLWVQADEDRQMYRVRTWASGRRKGEVVRDDGPMWQRSSTSYLAQIVDKGHTYTERAWFAHRGRGACLCCEDQEAGTG